MNNFQKHINKMTKINFYYANHCSITSYYKIKKELIKRSKVCFNWEIFKMLSQHIRDEEFYVNYGKIKTIK